MKSFLKTVIGGAIGCIALYAVGRVAYDAGKRIAREECKYEELKQKNQEMENQHVLSTEEQSNELICNAEKKRGKASSIKNVIGIFAKRNSILRSIIRNPEDHKIEAWFDNEELHMNVSRRNL